jgi:hypothetical protein
MCWFSFWWKVPKGYMTLELFFVSARTIKRHHHHFASDIDTRKSVTGYLMVLNGGPISWKASRQGGVTLISSEAEFVAASQAGQKLLFTFGRSSKGLPTCSMVLQRFGKITRLASL